MKRLLFPFVCLLLLVSLIPSAHAAAFLYKLQPKYLTVDFNAEMIASVVTVDEHHFFTTGEFRTKDDFSGVRWETVDQHSHPSLRYPARPDFSNVVLRYDYRITGHAQPLNSDLAPTLTVETNEGDVYYVRLWNYVVDASTGTQGTVELDFNRLYAGWSPDAPDWSKVPVTNIKSLLWSMAPAELPETGSSPYRVDFLNWTVSGNTFLAEDKPAAPLQPVRLTDDYDDSYQLTPQRIVEEYQKLGYGGIVNFYIGASHFYDKGWNGSEIEMLTDHSFNTAFESWYQDYAERLSERDIDLIHSISMENVDAPADWWQRTWDNVPAATMWTPAPHLLSFTNPDVQTFYKRLAADLTRLSSASGLTPILQLGEPWWWFLEGSEGQPPTFYDQATRALFLQEKGYPMHEFKSALEPTAGHEEMLHWLRDQNGQFATMLRDEIKKEDPHALFTVLFFPPSVLDRDRVPPMMSTVNFPKAHWQAPNLDFFMLEDYDYLINDQMDKHEQVLTFAQQELGYVPEQIHYFAGFVPDSEQSLVWGRIDQALQDGFQQGFAENYVWSIAQIRRDGWTP